MPAGCSRGAGRTAAALASALWLALVLAGCATRAPDPGDAATAAAPATPSATRPAAPDPRPEAAGSWPQAAGQVLGRNDRLLLYRPAAGDSWSGIAARFLQSAERGWQIADANDLAQPQPGVPLIVPLRALNPLGILPDRTLQTVPILCYHRLGPSTSKMVTAPAAFEAQMTWLVRNGYRVVRLAEVAAFLAGEQGLPQRAVVVTFDDGYESVHRHAFPVLKKLGIPATVFVYTDFLGGGDALTWPQLQDLQASGLVDIQSHSKSHRNLVERRAGEGDDRYRANLEAEMRVPRDVLEKRLPQQKVRHLAYPFGDANEQVTDAAARAGFELAATVVPGGNAFFAQPLLLRRTMIFGDMNLDAFKARVQVMRPFQAP